MKIILCDDDDRQRGYYSEKLKFFAQKHNIDVEFNLFESGKELLFHIENQTVFYDMIFLDICMTETDGIKTAEKLREYGYLGEIIFLTVSKDHFLPAFDVRAFHYIIKEVTSDEKIEKIFLKAAKAVEEKEQESIILTAGGEYRNILLKDIVYFEIVKRIITVHYKYEKSFTFFSSLGKLENQLIGKGLIRVHRAFVVSLAYIENVSSKEILLRDGTRIPVGRTYYQRLKDALHIKKIG